MLSFNKFFRNLSLIVPLMVLLLVSCNKGDDPNSDIPYANINVVINPNSTLYQELNVVGGWMYYQYVNPPSRGLIIYRVSNEDFKAYERTPPMNSNACCDVETGVCAALIVEDFPIVYDTCSDYSFLIYDGSPYSPATVPLKSYRAVYDGTNLYITN